MLTILLNIKSPYSDWFRSLRHLSFSETHFFIKSHIMNAGKIDLGKKSRDLLSVMWIHMDHNGSIWIYMDLHLKIQMNIYVAWETSPVQYASTVWNIYMAVYWSIWIHRDPKGSIGTLWITFGFFNLLLGDVPWMVGDIKEGASMGATNANPYGSFGSICIHIDCIDLNGS